MKKYIFTGTKNDVESLGELGYIDNSWGRQLPIYINEYDEFEAIKTFDQDKVAVTISYVEENREIDIYTYKGKPDAHKEIGKPDNPLKYIQELIDCGLAIEE